MIQSRKGIIENAVKKVFGDQVKLKFSGKKINISNSEKSQQEVIENTDAKKIIRSKDSQHSALPSKKAREEVPDNSPKNLANFFNGEIIDFDE